MECILSSLALEAKIWREGEKYFKLRVLDAFMKFYSVGSLGYRL